jgi:hypothetical protein
MSNAERATTVGRLLPERTSASILETRAMLGDGHKKTAIARWGRAVRDSWYHPHFADGFCRQP